MPSGFGELGAFGEAIGKAIAHLMQKKPEVNNNNDAVITQKPMEEGRQWDREPEHHSQTGYYPVSNTDPQGHWPRSDGSVFAPLKTEQEEDEDFQRSVEAYRQQQAQAEAQRAAEANAQRDKQLNAKFDLVQSMGAEEQRKSMSPADWQRIQIERQRSGQR